jgi:hypothetical protein
MQMSYEERGTWVYLVVSAGVYVAYAAIVLSQAADPITETPYQVPLLWSIGASIVAAMILRMLVEIAAGSVRGTGDQRADTRDREIDRLGTLRTWLVLAVTALAAMLMALAEWPHFWIANLLYFGFVLQAVSSAIVKLVAYRRGF